ncbi:hypothetical protein J6590_063981 [Homalodisca vitripennis]|nr:hypothetical protein J6590_063981 [Homalodisca vitripennis]
MVIPRNGRNVGFKLAVQLRPSARSTGESLGLDYPVGDGALLTAMLQAVVEHQACKRKCYKVGKVSRTTDISIAKLSDGLVSAFNADISVHFVFGLFNFPFNCHSLMQIFNECTQEKSHAWTGGNIFALRERLKIHRRQAKVTFKMNNRTTTLNTCRLKFQRD